MPQTLSDPVQGVEQAEFRSARQRRSRTLKLAWSTLLVSKVVTFATQALAVPMAYRSLGTVGFAAYSAVTAWAHLIWVFNLGVGGALVTPLARAAAAQDIHEQRRIVQSGLLPLFAVTSICLMLLPLLALVPTESLFGNAATGIAADIRPAAIIALVATLLMIPLSAADSLRQAYQEMHISMMVAIVFNAITCISLISAAIRHSSLPVIVGAFMLPTVAGKLVNAVLLLRNRPYLLNMCSRAEILRSCPALLGDGVRYLASSFSNALVYQWPIYWIARTSTASEATAFAISTQLALVPVSSVLGLVQPLWSPLADAVARGDRRWIRSQIKTYACVVIAIAGLLLAVLIWAGEPLVRVWMGTPVHLALPLRALIGSYIGLALWEGLFSTCAFGLGQLRPAAQDVFFRTLAFAATVPLTYHFAGIFGVWATLCLSALLWTAWRLPMLFVRASRCQLCPRP